MKMYPSIHPSIIYHRLSYTGSQGGATRGRSPVHRRADMQRHRVPFTHLQAINRVTNSPNLYVFGVWEESRVPAGNPCRHRGGSKLHTERPWTSQESNPGLSCCEATVLITTPPCRDKHKMDWHPWSHATSLARNRNTIIMDGKAQNWDISIMPLIIGRTDRRGGQTDWPMRIKGKQRWRKGEILDQVLV